MDPGETAQAAPKGTKLSGTRDRIRRRLWKAETAPTKQFRAGGGRENLSGSETEGETAERICRGVLCIFYGEGRNLERKTPLYDAHVALGGKIVPFAGYLLPVEYPTGVIAEHRAVRAQAGLFDVSHMGEATLRGAVF